MLILPVFSGKIGSHRAEATSLWGLREWGVPGVPALGIGAFLVLAGAMFPADMPARRLRACVAGLAVAETLGIVVITSFGLTLAVASASSVRDVELLPGLPVLFFGSAAMLVGTWGQWLANRADAAPH
ncbi:hypothetical protein AB0I35_28570 [Nocardia sp. NPDC050378]|uniref:hypothetical protein n=1 Tax=Nocardia sp. NPDC050378 TaxID=3155400 RepID=UPI0034052D2C